FVTGTINNDIATVAYNASSGASLWTVQTAGPASGDGAGRAVGLSSDGTRIFITGSSPDASGNNAITTIAYDSAGGHQDWVTQYQGTAGSRFGTAPQVAGRRSAVYIAGSSGSATGAIDYAVVVLSPLDGSISGVVRTPTGETSSNSPVDPSLSIAGSTGALVV